MWWAFYPASLTVNAEAAGHLAGPPAGLTGELQMISAADEATFRNGSVFMRIP